MDRQCDDGEVHFSVGAGPCRMAAVGSSNTSTIARGHSAAKRSQDGRKEIGGDGRDCRDDEPAALRVVGDARLGVVDEAENLVRPSFELPPRLGQAHSAAEPFEQWTTQLAFQLLDLLAEGRLRDVASLGGAREVAHFGHLGEVSELVHFHRRRLSMIEFRIFVPIGSAGVLWACAPRRQATDPGTERAVGINDCGRASWRMGQVLTASVPEGPFMRCVPIAASLVLFSCIGCGDTRTSPESARYTPPGKAGDPAAALQDEAGRQVVDAARKPAKGEAGEQATGKDEPAPQRRIIYTGVLEVVVKDLDAARQRLLALIDTHKGYVVRFEVTGNPGSPRVGSWTVRVPVERYGTFVEEAAQLGEATRNSSDAKDVTEEYVDVEARIRNKKVEEERLVGLMKNATGKIEDVLAVEKELARVRGEVEQAQGRINYLSRMSSYSTVQMTLREIKDYKAPTSATFGTLVSRRFDESVGALEDFGKGVVLVAVALAPWLPLIVVVGVVAWRWYRRRRAMVEEWARRQRSQTPGQA